MKKESWLIVSIIGIFWLISIGFVYALPDSWFVQDFEDIAPGRYKSLDYAADGVDVTLTGISGPLAIVENGLGGLLGERSLSSGGTKGSSVLIEFSQTIHGVTLDLMSECGRLSSVAVLTCFDVDENRLIMLTNKGRPCNQLTRTGAAILGEQIISHCRLSGIADNFLVEP